MRPLVVVGVVVALGVLAAALARLGGTLAQLRALDLPAAPGAAVVHESSSDASVLLETAVPMGASEASAEYGSAELAPQMTSAGDQHIMRALVADPEFQRAAAELLQDPDPAVHAEARQLLHDLGHAQSE